MVKQQNMKIIFLWLAVLISALAPILVRAGGEEVVVVYNTRVPESKVIAEHYAQMRQVPEKQIYGFPMTTNEEMSRAEFRNSLQLPLAKKVEANGLWDLKMTFYPGTNNQPDRAVRKVVSSKIRYAVLCYGVPLKIASDAGIHELAAGKMQPELRRNEAAVDSELSWLPLLQMEFPLTGPFPNWLYGTTNVALLNPTNGILLVARLDGPTPEIANGLVDKALQAERDGLWGRAYFDARGIEATNSYFLGDQWILTAAKILRQLGFETVIDDKPETFSADFPMSQIAIYCGWYDPNVSGPFTLPKVEFMPGAFAYHLHSYSANTIRSTTENWCGPLLAKGATCTMGMNHIFPPRQTSRNFWCCSARATHLVKPRGQHSPRCRGKQPSSAIRFTGRLGNRRSFCTRNFRASTVRYSNGHSCGSQIWVLSAARAWRKLPACSKILT
jgi:uncharacterized protein (TIGR03790 family)